MLAGRAVHRAAAHPAASASSLHALWDPAWHPDESGTFDESVGKALRYMAKVDEGRRALPALTVRYEDLTAAPETVTRQMCDFLGVGYEPAMLDYGRFGHDGLVAGLGDSSVSIRSGRIQATVPPPQQIPAALADICISWGYLKREDDPRRRSA